MTWQLSNNTRAALGLDRSPPATLVEAVQRACQTTDPHVTEELLDHIGCACMRSAADFLLFTDNISLSGWFCRCFFPTYNPLGRAALRQGEIDGPYREFPDDMLVRDPDAPECLVSADCIETKPGVVQVLFRDPLGIWCDTATLERMAKERWNWGMGWWR